MKNTKIIRIISIVTILVLMFTMLGMQKSNATEEASIKVDLTNLKYTVSGQETILKTYTQNQFETFLKDYNSGKLPSVYVTEFLFDGVSMVKTYDLDDFTESGNDVEVKTLSLKVINVNTTGNIEFTGEIKGGMIAVNTNEVNGEINLILNGVNIDTDSKKAPAIYVYNKDITYTGCKVTIKTAENSKNYVEGGKFKKVSLVGSDELSNYTSKYSGDMQTTYTQYTKYYGVYTSEQIKNVLFAKVEADSEDLKDGDPYYFYKGAGAISSDIDLYFEGTGYLEVTSKNKEGIETKGNLTFQGGTGDYVIYAEDDCLNTTTKSSSSNSARNALTIDVNSLIAIVDSGEDADEGDAIDSNGTLTINGGTILAVAHSGQDAGLDSEKETYINGGTVVATGDMLDAISSESKQRFMVLSFQNAVEEDTLITVLNSNKEVIASYKTDRTYKNLVISSPKLEDGTYYVYSGGTTKGKANNGLYTEITSYSEGKMQGYAQKGNISGMPSGMQNGNEPPQMPEGESNTNEPPQRPDEENNTNEPPQKPDGENNTNEPPQKPDGENNTNEKMGKPADQTNSNLTADNKKFEISGISNQFSGVGNYTGTDNKIDETTNTENSATDSNSLNNLIKIQNIIIGFAIVIGLIVVGTILFIANKKKNNKE